MGEYNCGDVGEYEGDVGEKGEVGEVPEPCIFGEVGEYAIAGDVGEKLGDATPYRGEDGENVLGLVGP